MRHELPVRPTSRLILIPSSLLCLCISFMSLATRYALYRTSRYMRATQHRSETRWIPEICISYDQFITHGPSILTAIDLWRTLGHMCISRIRSCRPCGALSTKCVRSSAFDFVRTLDMERTQRPQKRVTCSMTDGGRSIKRVLFAVSISNVYS